MPIVTPDGIDWIEIDDSGPLVDWIELPDVSALEDRKLRGGRGILVPHAKGVYPTPTILDALDGIFLGRIYGNRDRDGNAVTGAAACRAQLRENRDFLVDEVFDPPGTSDGTRSLDLHIADGSSLYRGRVTIIGRLGVKGDTPTPSQTISIEFLAVDAELTLVLGS